MQFCRLSCRLITSACDLFCFPVAGGLFQFLLTLSDPTAALDHSYCVSGPMGLGTPPYSSRLFVWRHSRDKARCRSDFVLDFALGINSGPSILNYNPKTLV